MARQTADELPRSIATRALEEAYLVRDWSVRRAEAAGMLGAIAAAFGFAWLIFIMGGFVVLGVMILAGYDFKGVDLIIAALVSVILTLAYFASSMERQAKILSRGLRAIADLDE